MKRRGFVASLAAFVVAPAAARQAAMPGGIYTFGAGTTAVLHGSEPVVSEAMFAASLRTATSLEELSRQFGRMAGAMSHCVRVSFTPGHDTRPHER